MKFKKKKAKTQSDDTVFWAIFYALCFIAGIMLASCGHASVPCNDPNMKQFKQTMKDIQAIAAHPDSTFKHLHTDEIEVIKKKSEFDESLKIYLKFN